MKLLPLIITLIILLAPDLAFAAGDISADGLYTGGGLIPCGQTAANPCNTCHVVILANTIIKWLIGITFMIFAGMAVYAGVKMVISGGNSHAKEDAKGMFTNAFIGLMIILGAWLMVDTLLRFVLKNGETGNIDGYGPWAQVECVSEAMSDITALGITEAEFVALAQSDPDVARNLYNVGTNAGNCVPDTTGPCSAASLTAAFGGQATNAARILAAESGCNPQASSGTDKTSDGRSYSIGLWQINLSAHKMTCNNTTLDCPSAFRDTGRRNRYNIRIMEIVNDSLYQRCKTMAENPICNSQKAAELVRDAGDFGPWACSAKKCGINTTKNSSCRLRI